VLNIEKKNCEYLEAFDETSTNPNADGGKKKYHDDEDDDDDRRGGFHSHGHGGPGG